MKTNFLLLLALTCSLFIFPSCEEDDDVTADVATIVDIAGADEQFSTLVAALERTNLISTLESAGPFTVFAPTNAAFQQLGVDLNTITDAELSEILLYHVFGGTIRSADIQEGQTYVTTASTGSPDGSQLSMLVERSGNGVTINGNINVTSADITASNGIIHVIDQVALPLDVVGHAAANSQFTALVDALSTAPGDLVTVLSGEGPFTVFAPVNTAFESIEDVVSSLTMDQLATVLTYHVVAGSNVRSGDLSDDMSVMTVSGQEFTIDLDQGAQIIDQTGATRDIILTDVQATNGVIHVLQEVILPTL